jgi:hypothetical protein
MPAGYGKRAKLFFTDCISGESSANDRRENDGQIELESKGSIGKGL